MRRAGLCMEYGTLDVEFAENGELGLGYTRRKNGGVYRYEVVNVKDNTAASEYQKVTGVSLVNRVLSAVNGAPTDGCELCPIDPACVASFC